MNEEIKVQIGSNNIFADLDLPNPEEMLLKAELVFRISEAIQTQNLEEDEAAKLLQIELTQVSALIEGKLNNFSVERLFRFLNALGNDVEISVKHKPDSRTTAITTVV